MGLYLSATGENPKIQANGSLRMEADFQKSRQLSVGCIVCASQTAKLSVRRQRAELRREVGSYGMSS